MTSLQSDQRATIRWWADPSGSTASCYISARRHGETPGKASLLGTTDSEAGRLGGGIPGTIPWCLAIVVQLKLSSFEFWSFDIATGRQRGQCHRYGLNTYRDLLMPLPITMFTSKSFLWYSWSHFTYIAFNCILVVNGCNIVTCWSPPTIYSFWLVYMLLYATTCTVIHRW